MCYLYEKDLIEIENYETGQDYEIESKGLKWETWTGSEWNPAVLQDETEGFRKSGMITFSGFKGWKADLFIQELGYSILKNISTPYFWLRCVVEEPNYEYPPRIDNLKLNTVSAIHGMKVESDNLKMPGNGLPGQVFKLNENKPDENLILKGTLKLSVEGEIWDEVDYFEGSGPSDKHFVLDTEKGEINFGDGLMGLVPEGSVIKVLEYMVGGGEEGNLMPGSIWKIDGFSGSIVNELASTGGKEAQTIEEAIEDFRRDLKVPCTAVTLKDFEQIAISTPGLRIASAKAIANYDPHNPDNGRGSVTVVIIPYTPLEDLKIPPEPSERFKHAVCLHLDKSRLIGTDVHVISPVYVKVSITATIVPVESFRDDSLIKEKVNKKLISFIHPVKGGFEGKGWPIGRDVYLSDLYGIIENIEGVSCVTGLSVSGDQGSFTDADGNLILKSRLASVYSGIHKVEIVRETDRCPGRGDSYSGK
jgi:predicted phage baseplate assembly protein